ncbi:MAG: transcription termination/antitermination protein NusG, partial [Alphaproteobacteria bacterium]|nr:transcription termination/antitermination protein NusG [Alphaproteobacteria bacterium]
QSKRKFFPGYVLIQADMDDIICHKLRNMQKVTDFLGTKGTPVPLPRGEEQRLLEQIRDGVTRARPSVTFEVGEKVRVAHGPFSSFNGIVEEVDEERARLKVSVSIFGRSTPVDLEYSQVEKI